MSINFFRKFFLCLLFLVPTIASAAVTVHYATEDTRIQDGYGNGGSLDRCQIFDPGSGCLYRFDFTGINSADILDATITLQYTNTGGTFDGTVYRLLVNGWVEDEATYYISSTGVNWDSSGALTDGVDFTSANSVTGPTVNGSTYEEDVTDLVKDMIDNGHDTIIYRNDGATIVNMYTSEETGTTFDPRIVIRTSVPGEPDFYYVRTDGGTCGLDPADQCDGTANVAYPGSGTLQECACSDIQEAFDLMNGEDVLTIASGTYNITTTLTAPVGGSSKTARTTIRGEGWDGTCNHDVVLTGDVGNDAEDVLTIEDFTEVDCIKITDTDGCIGALTEATGKIDDEATQDNIACDDGITGGIAGYGLKIANSSDGILLRDVLIEGMAAGGIEAYNLGDLDAYDLELVGNGFVGWSADPPSGETGNSNGELEAYTGTINWTGGKLNYSGCGWRYKATPGGKSAGTPHNCYTQGQGGYGDGFGIEGGSGSWTLIDVETSFNMSDALDFLYSDTGYVYYERVRAEGNRGAAFKSNNKDNQIYNSFISGNCQMLDTADWVYPNEEAPGRSGSNCNTDGNCDADENGANCADCTDTDPCRAGTAMTMASENGTFITDESADPTTWTDATGGDVAPSYSVENDCSPIDEAKKCGGEAVSFLIGSGAGVELLAYNDTVGQADWSDFDRIGAWVRADTNTSLGDLKIVLDDTAGCGSPIESYSVPALTADTWTWMRVDFGTPANLSAIACIGLTQDVDIGSATFLIDNIVATGETGEGGSLLIHNSTLTASHNIIIELGGRDCVNWSADLKNNIYYGLEKWGGGVQSDLLYQLHTDDGNASCPGYDINDIDEDYNIFCNLKDYTEMSGANSFQCEDGTDDDGLFQLGVVPDSIASPYVGEDFIDYFYPSNTGEAADAADEGVTQLNSSNDVNDFARGASWDIGCLESDSEEEQVGGDATTSINGFVIKGCGFK